MYIKMSLNHRRGNKSPKHKTIRKRPQCVRYFKYHHAKHIQAPPSHTPAPVAYELTPKVCKHSLLVTRVISTEKKPWMSPVAAAPIEIASWFPPSTCRASEMTSSQVVVMHSVTWVPFNFTQLVNDTRRPGHPNRKTFVTVFRLGSC